MQAEEAVAVVVAMVVGKELEREESMADEQGRAAEATVCEHTEGG